MAATTEEALKPFVLQITGPLIRIIGDRFPWEIKAAILQTLGLIIGKGRAALKPFVPQLQTSFLKCLTDTTPQVRAGALLDTPGVPLRVWRAWGCVRHATCLLGWALPTALVHVRWLTCCLWLADACRPSRRRYGARLRPTWVPCRA